MTFRKKPVNRLKWILPLIILAILFNTKTFWRFMYPFPHKGIILEEASANNIDPLLVAAIIKTESNFASVAESARGARGIMQIMPETGSWAADQMDIKDFHPDDLYEIETNIRIGCWYLNNLNREFRGNKMLVVASYNAGRGNVRQWLEQDKWSGEQDAVDQIPFPETREYVRRVLKNYQWYRHLYGDKPS